MDHTAESSSLLWSTSTRATPLQTLSKCHNVSSSWVSPWPWLISSRNCPMATTLLSPSRRRRKILTLGVIHRGHEKESLSPMKSYLPKDSTFTSSRYAQRGGLYALGLIHAKHLLNQVKEVSGERIKQGGCLAAMETHRVDVYEQLKFFLYQDDGISPWISGVGKQVRSYD